MSDPRVRQVCTDEAPRAIGPYSQGIAFGGLVFCSGQIPLDATSGTVVAGGVAEQTRCVLRHLSAVLSAAGSDLGLVVKTTVYLRDMGDFPAMNGVYAEAFGSHRPARATVEVSRLPKDVLVEIDCIAAQRG